MRFVKMIDDMVLHSQTSKPSNEEVVRKSRSTGDIGKAKEALAQLRAKKLELLEWQIQYSTYMLMKA